MKFLIIGLGSMGKRRIRCLKALNIPEENIYGFDIREDRREEARKKYRVQIKDVIDDTMWNNIDAVIISVPPDKHLFYMKKSFQYNKPMFVEASVILSGLEEFYEKTKHLELQICTD